MAFRGQHDYTLDAKNRLNLPPRWRGELSEGLVLSKWFEEPCITLWTPAGFDAISERYLEGLNPLSPRHRKLTRFFTQNSWDVSLDASGRLTLSQPLLRFAGISDKVVVAGSHDHVEIWNPERWAEMQRELAAEIAEVADGLDDAG